MAGYSKLGLPGSMVPNASATGSFVDASFGLRYHSDSAHLRGMKLRASATTMAGTTGTDHSGAVAERHQHQSAQSDVRHLSMSVRAAACSNLIGSKSSQSGGNSMAPPTMVISAAMPTKVSSSQDSSGLVSTGQLGTLLPNPADVTNVLESMKRISDAKYAQVQAYTDPTLNAAALGTNGHPGLRLYQGGLHRRPVQQSFCGESGPRSEHRRDRAAFSRPRNIRRTLTYRKTAAVMKLVIDGNAAAGTIEMGGFDYHSGNRMDGEGSDLNLGNCIGACLEYASRVGKPVMIYVFSDGSLASNGMIDSSAGGRGKGVWTADNQNVAATYFLVFNPAGRAVSAQANAEMSLQIGSFNTDGSQNTTGSPAGNNVPNLVQMVVLNYMALHSANAAARMADAVPGAEFEQHLGIGQALDPLIAWQPLAGLVNGNVA